MIRSRTYVPVLIAAATVVAVGFQTSGCAFDDGGATSPAPSKPAMVVGSSSGGGITLDTQGIPTKQVKPVDGSGGDSAPLVMGSQAAVISSGGPVDTQCGQDSQPAGIRPVVLMFAFDASASMGEKTARPYYDPDKKWKPVVAASKAFFGDAASVGLSATLTFFPQENPTAAATSAAPVAPPAPSSASSAGGMGGGVPVGGLQMGGAIGGIGGRGIDPKMCQSMTYATPDVPLTLLPSTAFATAMDAATPPEGATWRLGTPTQWALEGVQTQIAALKAAEQADHPNKYIVVLVTDGAPTDCTPTDLRDLGPVTKVIQTLATNGTPTYVIGVGAVEGDPTGPQLAGNLDKFAAAGGTDTAFIVDTGDPAKTSTDFKAIVDKIRNANKGCSIEIPKPPDGKTFDKTKVNVAYSDVTMKKTDLAYDPTCVAPNSWKFDNEAAPTAIEICEATCGIVQQTVEAKIDLSLGCKRVDVRGG